MRKLIFLSILSILLGGVIYIAFRSSSIILFKWIDYIVLIDPVENLRIVTLPYKEYLSKWFLYSLPDGLWMFSYSCIVLVIWKRKITKYSLLWLLSLPMISILFEVLQYYNYFNGTFDIVDIFFFLMGSLLPILINKKMKNENSN
jgi:hypothetical protein|tara:strand:+ start:5820 stop:6254 length:435 start_codon:yes stop_codon:yes gene_type:complete